ncbi:MAG: hypothetical protein H7196_03080 [candidate division SR1 bacterium]|nr:hypothetical protein [candidate division SR1 bacterium]
MIVPFSIIFTSNYFLTPKAYSIKKLGCKKEIKISWLNSIAYLFFVYTILIILILNSLHYAAFNDKLTSEMLINSLNKVIADLEKVNFVEPTTYGEFINQMSNMVDEIKIPMNGYFITIHNQKLSIIKLIAQISFLPSSKNS